MKNKGLKVLTGVLAAVSIFTMAGGLADRCSCGKRRESRIRSQF